MKPDPQPRDVSDHSTEPKAPSAVQSPAEPVARSYHKPRVRLLGRLRSVTGS